MDDDSSSSSSAPLPDADWSLLARYVAGQVTEGQRRRVRAWAKADPANAALLADIERVWRISAQTRQWDAERALMAIKQRRSAHTRSLASVWAGVRVAPGRRQAVWRCAAIVPAAAAALGIVLIVESLRHNPKPAAGREYSTAAGERATIKLSDGTEVVLAPASRIRVSGAYEGARRDVWLDGEATFTVVHNARRPFVVDAGQAIVEDVGTRFDVRAYADEGTQGSLGSVRVAVVEGAVAVRGTRPAAPATTVRSGEVTTVDARGNVQAVRTGNTRVYLTWTEGHLAFQNEPMRAVAAEISRWYGVSRSLGDSALGRRRITTSFTTEPVADVLRALADALDADIERRDTAFVLVTRPGPQPGKPRS
jgi:transmembrane sensor